MNDIETLELLVDESFLNWSVERLTLTCNFLDIDEDCYTLQ